MKKFEKLRKKLSKEEQKKIIGGLQDDGGQCGTACSDTTPCKVSSGHSGHCHKPSEGPNAGKCFCVAVY